MKKEAETVFKDKHFDVLILDEVQQLKNIRSLGAYAARRYIRLIRSLRASDRCTDGVMCGNQFRRPEKTGGTYLSGETVTRSLRTARHRYYHSIGRPLR